MDLIGGERFDILIKNLSFKGLGGTLRQEAGIQIGDQIRISFQGIGPLDAKIRWTSGFQFGVEFMQILESEALELCKTVASDPKPHIWQVSTLHRVLQPRVDLKALRKV
ncbi:MAG: hypothetical protein KGL44_09765 [Sphingomonadales bacterium]|nr:hypothetical protein [Sphingomonadales bacterium]